MLKRLFGSVLGGVSVLSTGTLLGQAIYILVTTFLLKDYFSTADFGDLANFLSITSFLSIISTLRYELAVPMISTFENRVAFVQTLTKYILYSSLVLGLILVLTPLSLRYSILLMIGVGLTAFQVLFKMWFLTEKKYQPVFFSNLLRPLLQVTVPLGLYYTLGADPYFLYLGVVVGLAVSVVFIFPKELFMQLDFKSKASVKINLREHINFPKFTAVSTLINQIGVTLLPIWMTLLFDKATVGNFSMVVMLYAIPVGLLGQTLGQVIYPYFAEWKNDKVRFKKVIHYTLIVMYSIGTVCFIPLAFFGEEVILYVLGSKWKLASEFSRVLVVYYLFMFVSSPISGIPQLFGLQKRAMQVSIFEMLLRCLALFLGAYLYESSYVSIVLFSFASSAIYLYYIGWMLRIAQSSMLEVLGANYQLFTLDVFLFILIVINILSNSFFESNYLIEGLVVVLILLSTFIKVNFLYRESSRSSLVV